MTAIVALVSASFASPIALKGDALASLGIGGKGAETPLEEVEVGGRTFDMPAQWGRLSAAAAQAADVGAGSEAGDGASAVAVCPAGTAGAECRDGLRVSFVTYEDEGSLPLLIDLETSLDAGLAKGMRGFRKADAASQTSADGTRWLSYEFTYARGRATNREQLAAYREADGTGVVAVVTGPPAAFEQHERAIDAFLASSTSV